MSYDIEDKPEIQITIEEEIEIVLDIFRYNLKLLRSFDKISAEDLSVKLKMNRKRISELEYRSAPKFSEIVKIVDYFPITFDDLLDGKIELYIRSRHIKIKYDF